MTVGAQRAGNIVSNDARLELARMAGQIVAWSKQLALGLLFQIRSESDPPSLRRRGLHELADGGENRSDLLVVLGELLIESRLENRRANSRLELNSSRSFTNARTT